MTFRFGGKATRATAVIGRRKEAVSPEQQAELRRQRLILTVAGSIAFSGLAILAYNYTAPFADPPSFAVSAQATAAVPRVVVAEPERPAVESSEVAAEPVERVTLAPEPAFETASLPPVTAPVETAAAIEVDIPESDDPRWGSARTAATLSSSEAPAEGGELAYAAGAPAAVLKRTVLDDSTDDTETSAIPRSSPAIEADDTDRPSADVGRAANRTATIASAVNMRAKGAKGARVIGVIPRGATVGLVGCDSWCEVIYEGRRGFIYKSFLGGSGRSTGDADKSRKTTKTKIVPVRQQHNDIDHIGR